MREFQDRVAVVTGAASGIGRAMAERFALDGMRVVLADVEEDALQAAVAELTAKELDVLGVPTDVSQLDAVEALAKRTVEHYGAVHVVCNNAGVAGDLDFLSRRGERLWEHSMKDWHWTFDVNFWGVVYGIRTFLPIMLEQGDEGHVVNTASMAGLLSGPTADIYGATKHAVVRITEALHFQLALEESQIKASVLCPGIIKTRIFSSGRNRPDELMAGPRPADDELVQRVRQADDAWAVDGLSADEVATQVAQAIRDEQFYILTRDVPLDRIRARVENIVEGRNPVLPPPRAAS